VASGNCGIVYFCTEPWLGVAQDVHQSRNTSCVVSSDVCFGWLFSVSCGGWPLIVSSMVTELGGRLVLGSGTERVIMSSC
jgi:hypothetical protein